MTITSPPSKCGTTIHSKDCEHFPKSPQPSEPWELEFNEKWPTTIEIYGNKKLLKDFIRSSRLSAISDYKEKLRKKAEEMKQDENLITEENAPGVSELVKLLFRTHNKVLDDILDSEL